MIVGGRDRAKVETPVEKPVSVATVDEHLTARSMISCTSFKLFGLRVGAELGDCCIPQKSVLHRVPTRNLHAH